MQAEHLPFTVCAGERSILQERSQRWEICGDRSESIFLWLVSVKNSFTFSPEMQLTSQLRNKPENHTHRKVWRLRLNACDDDVCVQFNVCSLLCSWLIQASGEIFNVLKCFLNCSIYFMQSQMGIGHKGKFVCFFSTVGSLQKFFPQSNL